MSVNKAAIDFSIQGEKPVVKDIPELTREQIVGGESVTTSESPRVIFKLMNFNGKGRVWIDPIDDNIMNPATGKRERIQVIRGVSTIWSSEQKDVKEEYISKNRRSTLFEDSVCVLDKKRDATWIEFFRVGNHNVKNKDRSITTKFEIYEWSAAEQEAEAFKKELEEIEVTRIAFDQPLEMVKKHGLYLGIPRFLTDEMGEARTEKGLRALYVIYAKRNPKAFKESLDSKAIEVNYLVRKAIVDAMVDIGGNTGIIKWANGGTICAIPKGRNVADYLVEYALMPTEDSKQFLERLQTLAAK